MSGITSGLVSILGDAVEQGKGLLEDPLATGVAGALVGATVAGATIAAVSGLSGSGTTSTRKTGRKIKHTARGWKQDRARRSKQKWEVAYQKRKRKLARMKAKRKKSSSTRRRKVYHTKNGQPYIKLKSGKARFIKKRR